LLDQPHAVFLLFDDHADLEWITNIPPAA